MSKYESFEDPFIGRKKYDAIYFKIREYEMRKCSRYHFRGTVWKIGFWDVDNDRDYYRYAVASVLLQLHHHHRVSEQNDILFLERENYLRMAIEKYRLDFIIYDGAYDGWTRSPYIYGDRLTRDGCQPPSRSFPRPGAKFRYTRHD